MSIGLRVVSGLFGAFLAVAVLDAAVRTFLLPRVASVRLSRGIAIGVGLLFRVLAPARFDLTIKDRFGRPVQPREWYLVPLSVVDELVEKIRDGSIVDFKYDPASASLIAAEP